VDADAKLNALVGRDLGVALDHCPLDFDGAVNRVDDAAELDDASVTRLTTRPWCTAMVGSIRSLRRVRRRARIRSSSAPASREYPTTSDTKIAASLRVSPTALAFQPVTAKPKSGDQISLIRLGMAAFSMLHLIGTRRPGMQARRSVISLAALVRCLRQSNPENNSMFLLERSAQ
jgi:hypothetical protein